MKNILFLMSEMSGGGAERVISLLTSEFSNMDYNVTLIITSQDSEFSDISNISDNVKVIFLNDLNIHEKESKYLFRLISKFSPDYSRIYRFYKKNKNAIHYIKKIFPNDFCIISFLNIPIFLSLFLKNKTNRLIISDRGDPSQFLKTKTTMAFIHKMYPKADMMVCQSPDAEKWYKENSKVKTTVIFNPIKPNLPEPFSGERNKTIVNFCRISEQKNLVMLVKAFALLHKDYPEYILKIIGDAVGNGVEGYLDTVKTTISELSLDGKVLMEPGRSDIHDYVRDCAMFVSSSDFEGMSNSMLEAMAMGMPVVCTDCPAGGARAVIKDRENGLLVPVGYADAMYKAMKEIIENPTLAENLSKNATHIRETQSVDSIINQWLDIINE